MKGQSLKVHILMVCEKDSVYSVFSYVSINVCTTFLLSFAGYLNEMHPWNPEL